MKFLVVCISICLFLSPVVAVAGNTGLIISGRSYHFDRTPPRNERNWGLGLEHEYNPTDRWVRFSVVNAFVDSMDNMSYMTGYGIKRRFFFQEKSQLYFDAGAVAFVMTRKEYHGHRPFPGVLPAITLGGRIFAANLIYVPGFEPITEESLFLQLRINLNSSSKTQR